MASRIAALQAKLGGGAMIMGMRPGGAPPMRRKKKRQRRASLDNSALLDRTVINKGNRKKKRITVNFDALADDEKGDPFAQSMSSNINMKKTKPINNSSNENKSNDNKSNEKKKKYGMGGGMGGLLAKAGGFKRKSKKTSNKNKDNNKNSGGRERGQSRSFTKGVTTTPLISVQPSKNINKTQTQTPTPKMMSKKRKRRKRRRKIN
eukprot:991589_1